MELWASLLPSPAVAIALILISATLALQWRRWHTQPTRKAPLPLPPGRLGLPIIGETPEFLRTLKENRLNDFFSVRVEKYGEVFKTSLLGDPTVCFPAPSGNKFLFSSENSLVVSRWPRSVVTLLGEHSIGVQTGDRHKRTRSVLMAFLGPDSVQKYVGKMCDVAQKHIAGHWEGRSQVAVHGLMRHFTMSAACSLFASLEDEEEQAKLVVPFAAFSAGLFQLPIDLPWTLFRKAKLGRAAIDKELDRLIAKRRKELEEGLASADQDLVSSLLTTTDLSGNLLTDEEVKDNVLNLLFAGHDTTASTLSIAIMFLAQNPDALQLTVKEQMEIKGVKEKGERLNWEDLKQMKYTWRVVQETLRMQPPAQGAYRRAIVNFEYAGYLIPKGYQLQWSTYRSHKLEKFFPNPEKFDPSRFDGKGPQPYTFVPFGGGPRLCPGMEFAKMEMLVFLHYFVTSFVWSMVNPLEKVTIDPVARPKNGLLVNLSPK